MLVIAFTHSNAEGEEVEEEEEESQESPVDSTPVTVNDRLTDASFRSPLIGGF